MDLFESALPLGQVGLSSVLQEIDELLENSPEIIQEIKAIFEKHWPNSKNSSRASHPVDVIIRLHILKHLNPSLPLRDAK